MTTFWFAALAAMIVVYVLLDGFDFGVGIAHQLVARSEAERSTVLRTIGPFWDGNEVWLIAIGGTLVFTFPLLYATSFSGFFLPLMLVLWLLMGRGIALEFRNHVDDASIWKPFWDAIFAVSSGLLALFLGTALGAVVRGVPLQPDHSFFEPFFTHFGVTGQTGIADWYTLLVGVFAFVALTAHGSFWLTLKTGGELRERARRLARAAALAAGIIAVAVCAATWSVQPQIRTRLAAQPLGHVLTLLAAAGLAAALRYSRGSEPSTADHRAFAGSCAFLAGLLGVTAFGLYPYVLPSNGDPALGLTIHNAAASDYGLRAALWWWLPGIALAITYFALTHRRLSGRVESTD